MTKRDQSNASAGDDYALVERYNGQVLIEAHEWEPALRCHRSVTLLLDTAEAQSLAAALLQAIVKSD